MFRRWLNTLTPVSVYRPLRRPVFDVNVELERRQEVAREIVVADGKNVDKFITELPIG